MNKKIIFGIACAGLISLSSMLVGVVASDSIKDISAQINYGIKMKVDNVEWNPTETDGSAIRPITYKGRTYLPVRALGEKLGVTIDWDANTQTVLIGEKEWTPISASIVDTHSDMGYTKDSDKLFHGDGVYDFGCFVSSQWISNQFSDINISTERKYSKMKMGIFVTGGDKTITISDRETREILKQVTVKDGIATDIDFDISNVKDINIKWGGDNASTLVFGNIYVK